MATAGRRVSESESSEGSSNSDDSLLTDTSSYLCNLTCISHPLHRRHIEEKWINRHRNTLGLAIADSLNSDSVDERHLVCDFPLCPHIVSDVS